MHNHAPARICLFPPKATSCGSGTTEERLGDEHSGEQTNSSEEEKNSGTALLQQQQQDAEGNNGVAMAMAWYYLALQDIYCDAEAAEQAVNQAGSGFVKVKILMKLAQLKSNNGATLWFTMPNGDMYCDPLGAEAAVFKAGFKNLKVTHSLSNAGMDRYACIFGKEKKTWLPNSATTASILIRKFWSNRLGKGAQTKDRVQLEGKGGHLLVGKEQQQMRGGAAGLPQNYRKRTPDTSVTGDIGGDAQGYLGAPTGKKNRNNLGSPNFGGLGSTHGSRSSWYQTHAEDMYGAGPWAHGAQWGARMRAMGTYVSLCLPHPPSPCLATSSVYVSSHTNLYAVYSPSWALEVIWVQCEVYSRYRPPISIEEIVQCLNAKIGKTRNLGSQAILEMVKYFLWAKAGELYKYSWSVLV
ncbi:hypothetical protein B0H17DRAFT_1136424 [Mycena rosella]|uniref:Uncharacterized protein n=1 Tax=Mycena rosella TaxID=1033263 RepID=A0AAD7GC09_MYCRO|nr:hypothetical protein B0H17DRAFT_1136424 [Mycena rosella]